MIVIHAFKVVDVQHNDGQFLSRFVRPVGLEAFEEDAPVKTLGQLIIRGEEIQFDVLSFYLVPRLS